MKRLMLPNDARWTMGKILASGAIGMVPVFSSHLAKKLWFAGREHFFDKDWNVRLQQIRDAAAVAACWWITYSEDMYLQFKDDEGKKAEFMGYLWISLTTADSLDGYEFEPWKEME